MAGVNTLKDRLTRLDVLPTMVNWRGTWTPGSQYFQNDIVVSPLTFSTYILYIGTTISGGGDPSINSGAWVSISGVGIGVTGVVAGTDISVTNGNTNPTISNAGVLEVALVINGGIINGGDALNPILYTNDVASIVAAEPSIGVTQPTPGDYLITNLGVVNATGSANNGLSVTKDAAFNLTVANTGVLTLASGGGLTIDYPIDPEVPNVSNDGLISVVGGAGITTTQLNFEAEILNDGVRVINPGYGIYVVPGPTTTLRSKASKLSRIWSLNTITGPVPNPITQNQVATFTFTPITGNIFANYMANGTPEPAGAGTFLIDMSAFNVYWVVGNALGGRRILMNFIDTITPGGPYQSNTLTIQFTVTAMNSAANFSLGRLALNIPVSRANGMRLVNGFTIRNAANISAQGLNMTSVGDGWATYYPQTLTIPN